MISSITIQNKQTDILKYSHYDINNIILPNITKKQIIIIMSGRISTIASNVISPNDTT